MRIEIDADRCEGHGRCYSLAPDLFEPDELGQGLVLNGGSVPPDRADAARLAVANCPEQAIVVVED